VKLPVQLMEAQPERADDALRAHYERVLRVAGDHHFHEGRFEVLELRPFDGDDSWGTLVAYEWHSAAERTVCVVNLGEGGAQGRVVLDDELPDGEHVLTDALDGTRYSRDGAQMRGEGLHVILNRGQSHVFGIPH
jgi:hypothetical protein